MRFLLALLFFFLSLPVFANVYQIKGWEFSAYVDTSYNYLVRNHQFVSGVNDRVNDLTQNGFTLQQFSFLIEKHNKEGFGALFNGVLGRDAYFIAPYGWNGYYGSQTLGFVVEEAYLEYVRGDFRFEGGVFNSLIGEESNNPTEDTNFSRSILNGYAEPGVLMGARGFYTVNPQCKIAAGINNGWSGLRDTGRRPSIEAGLTYVFNPMISFIVEGISGEQRLMTRTATGPTGQRHLININAILNATDRLTLIGTLDYGVQSKALNAMGEIGRVVWSGVGAYANYQWTDQWRTSVRGELYDDGDGYTTELKQNWREITLTLSYFPIKGLELRGETRHDFSNVPAFMNATGPGANNNQQSYALEALYIF